MLTLVFCLSPLHSKEATLPVFSLTACTTAVKQSAEQKAGGRGSNGAMQQHKVGPERRYRNPRERRIVRSYAKNKKEAPKISFRHRLKQ